MIVYITSIKQYWYLFSFKARKRLFKVNNIHTTETCSVDLNPANIDLFKVTTEILEKDVKYVQRSL